MARIMVAMSGGVDSSVAAALLQQQGHDITGVTLKLWGGDQDSGCCAVSDVDDARRVAQQLDIDHFVFNYGDDFETHVVQPYVEAHAAGLTPNPCIECNRHVKFNLLTERARLLGFDTVATGHHVRIVETPDGRRLGRGADEAKDQSYVLYMLSAADLDHLMFPVGDLTKGGVRELAVELGLRTADKPDSQDLCFITESAGRNGFLQDKLELTPGELVDEHGQVIGSVPSVQLVTIGQRRGLDLGGDTERRYAVDIDVETRRVTVGRKQDLFTGSTPVVGHTWTAGAVTGAVQAQTSAHGALAPGVLDADGQLAWNEPRRKVAPGQAVVFYQDGLVVGGATATR